MPGIVELIILNKHWANVLSSHSYLVGATLYRLDKRLGYLPIKTVLLKLQSVLLRWYKRMRKFRPELAGNPH